MTDFSSFNLNPSIMKALKSKGYSKPTPIQSQAIPHVLEQKDVLAIAQTGTGKTAAFSLPIIHLITENKIRLKNKNVRCLILTPTRELASQIEQNIKTYSENLNLSSTVIFGGVGKTPQVNRTKKGVEILIATPGRLLDLMSEGHIKYEQLELFVLDEADRMLDMGFIHDIKKIIAKLPKKKQTLLFSATMPKDIVGLASKLLHKPVRVEVTPESTTVEKIEQKVIFMDKLNKVHLLKAIVNETKLESALVFTKTKHGADKVVKKLEQANILAAAIHGNKSQNARERALNNFKTGKINILVATDIAARGIDVPGVQYVFNFDLPHEPESYVHRIGRTARAGKEGIAISFCDVPEIKLLKNIEKSIRYKIPVEENIPEFEKQTAVAQPQLSRNKKPAQRSTRKETQKAPKGDDKKSSSRNRKRRR